MRNTDTNEALVSGRVRSGHATPDVAGWLALAATPTFSVMALWTGLFSAQPDMFCIGVQNGSPLNGMSLMYVLMSIVHAVPWLKLISRRPFISCASP